MHALSILAPLAALISAAPPGSGQIPRAPCSSSSAAPSSLSPAAKSLPPSPTVQIFIPPSAGDSVRYALAELSRSWPKLGIKIARAPSPPSQGPAIIVLIRRPGSFGKSPAATGPAAQPQSPPRSHKQPPAAESSAAASGLHQPPHPAASPPASTAPGRSPSSSQARQLLNGDSAAQSYRLAARKTSTGPIYKISAGGDLGAAYALLDLADLLPALAAAGKNPIRALSDDLPRLACGSFSPKLPFRAINLFLSLPYPPDRPWWFYSDQFWRTFLDLLAHSRFNWLDIHAMYDVIRTNFPNALPYFVRAPDFPDVGVPEDQRRRNLAQLRRVVEMAARRGIKVALMSYHSSWRVPGAQPHSHRMTDENLARYTRGAVAELLHQVPGLAMIGFRIGESGRREDFYARSYVPAILSSALPMAVYTRSWGARRDQILALARQFPGRFFLEIKYNGEQYGLPYIVAGGRMARWRDYSYQRYTSHPRPFSIIWQIRAAGTHRFFRWADPDWIRITARACLLDGAIGYSLEPPHAYTPQYDTSHRPDCGHSFPTFQHQRHFLWYLAWGRLTYNPSDPAFQTIAAWRLCPQNPAAGRAMLRRIAAASRIVSLIYAFHCFGPDHRSMAPEFETGGGINDFARTRPLDSFAFQSILDSVGRRLMAMPDARISPLQVADELEALARAATKPIPSAPASDLWACWSIDNAALSHLARYYAHKTRAAVVLELFSHTGDLWQAHAARRELAAAIAEWKNLAAVTARHYSAILDTLRMHDAHFRWRKLVPAVQADWQALRERLAGAAEAHSAKAPAIGHVPVHIARRGQPIPIRATAILPGKFHPPGAALPPKEAAQNQAEAPATSAGDPPRLELLFRFGTSPWQRLKMPLLPDGRAEANIPPPPATAKAVQYCLRLAAAGRQVLLPARGTESPFIIRLTADARPPRFSRPASIRVLSKTSTGAELEVSAACTDPDGIRAAFIWFKPLPSETRWRKRPARLRRIGRQWLITARLRSTPEGIMVAVEAVDGAGLAARSPAFTLSAPDIPYLWLDPWPGEAAAEPAPTLSAAALSKISPRDFPLLIAGRTALSLHRSPPAFKAALLNLVRRGCTLIIFCQDFPHRFSFDWLPGRIRAGDRDLNEVRFLPGHPLTQGLPAEVRALKIVNDALEAAEGWEILTDPPALALRREGRGQIIVCQLRALQLSYIPAIQELLRRMLRQPLSAGGEALVIDYGSEDLAEVLCSLLVPWQDLSSLEP